MFGIFFDINLFSDYMPRNGRVVIKCNLCRVVFCVEAACKFHTESEGWRFSTCIFRSDFFAPADLNEGASTGVTDESPVSPKVAAFHFTGKLAAIDFVRVSYRFQEGGGERMRTRRRRPQRCGPCQRDGP